MSMNQSGRRSGRTSGKSPARASGRSSSRGEPAATTRSSQRLDQASTSGRGSMRGKGPARTGGTEMAILLGVLLLLVVLVLVFWKIRSGEKQEAEQRKEEKTRAHRNNVALAYKVWQEAYNAGKNFVTGADTKLTKEDLAKVFGGRQEVYNVLLIRHYKAKKGKDEEARLELDSSRLTVNKVGSPELREGISIYYGTAEGNTVPIAIAEKHINVEEGDKVNTGGEITVIVRAEEEIKPGSITDPKAK